MNRLIIKVLDENGNPICVKIVLIKSQSTDINNSRRNLILLDYIDGEKTFEINESCLNVEAYCGKLYAPFKKEISFDTNESLELTVVMVKIFDPGQYGLYCFDAHNHVSRKYYDKAKTINLEKAAVIAKGEGLNGFFAGTPYDYDNHAEVKTGMIQSNSSYRKIYGSLIRSVSNSSFIMDIGNEYCKYRYGHVFMMNYEQWPPVDRYRDPLYYSYEMSRHIPSITEPPFVNMPIANAIFEYKGRNTAAIYAHPTSWWYDDYNHSFITNIASSLGFDILTGAIDALVIMGYKADQKYYRDIWFDLLDNGYFVTGVAETDAVMDTEFFEMPPFRTYAYTNELNVDNLALAVKAGQCMVTSGPVLHFTVDGNLPGSVLKRMQGKIHQVYVAFHACFEGNLSKLQIIRNGQLYKEIDILNQSTEELVVDVSAPDSDGYILALGFDTAGNLAVSNPVYIRNAPFKNLNYYSKVFIDVYQGKYPASGIYRAGEMGEEVHFDGRISCRIKPHEPIYIKVGDNEKKLELFYLDQLQRIFKDLYSGRFNADKEFKPGEVPASAFKIKEIRELLDSVQVRIDFLEKNLGDNAISENSTPKYKDTHIKNPLVNENVFLNKKYKITAIPSFEAFKKKLPIPIWKAHDSVLNCYDRAWEIAWSKLRQPQEHSGFVSNFLYTEFSNSIFMWGLSFVSQFGRYARRSFDFIGCMDNFYAKQHIDGFICRQINIYSGNDEFERFDPSSTGPNIMAWAEWEDYKISGDRERLKMIFPILLAFHRWLRKFRTWKDGTYYSSGWGCGMDNQPRMTSEYSPMFDHGHMSWIDITAQQILSAKTIVLIAKEIGKENEILDMIEEAQNLKKYINQYMWNDKEKFYFDRYRDGSLANEKTVGAYWTLLADVVPDYRLYDFVSHLMDGGCFYSLHRIPTIPINSPFYIKDGGDYWRGGVWCITNYMVIRGLVMNGYSGLAHDIARNHVEMMSKVFNSTGSIWESYDALRPVPGKCYGKYVRNEFVGFSGLGPITLLIEEVLGLKPYAADNILIWNINLTEEHGIKNYPFGEHGIVELSCAARKSRHSKPDIIAVSSICMILKVIWDGGEETFELKGSEAT